MLALRTINLVVLLIILPACLSHPSIRMREFERRECRGCGNECDKCDYGVVISLMCGVLECRKGPDERCGGYSNSKGVCGDGMVCLCERCIGCSTDKLNCSNANLDHPCLPRDNRESRYLDLERNNRFTLVK